AARDRTIGPAPSSVVGASCSTSLISLVARWWWHEKEPSRRPGAGGWLAALRLVPRAARDKQKTVSPIRPTVRGSCVMSGLAALPLPRGGHRSPASGSAERRDQSPGEQEAR